MEKIIIYFGEEHKVGCDEKCHKAWGIQLRPKIYANGKHELDDEDYDNPNIDVDDYEYLADNELDVAPIDPRTREGGHSKPQTETEKGNKWCVRQCERCWMCKPNKTPKMLDFTKRVSNITKLLK